MNRLIFLGLLFLMSCHSRSQTNLKADNSLEKNYKITVDKFLEDKKVSQLSKNLYLGKIKPNDNEYNLALIDSINTHSYTRPFYFLVITKTMKYADGSYTEPLGVVAKAFIENNTYEVLSYFKQNHLILTDDDFKNWAHIIYGEIQIDSEGSEQKAISELKAKMIVNLSGLTVDYKQDVEKFIRSMK